MEECRSLYQTTHELANKGEVFDCPNKLSSWPHPAEIFKIQYMKESESNKMNLFTIGVKSINGVGSGIVIKQNDQISYSKHKLSAKCSEQQAEQFALLKGFEVAERKLNNTKNIYISVGKHDTIQNLLNSNDHRYLTSRIKENIKNLVKDGWEIKFNNGINGANIMENCLARERALDAANSRQLAIEYNRIPKSFLKSDLGKRTLEKWQTQWNECTKGALTKTFFPQISKRLEMRLESIPKVMMLLSGHGKIQSYFYKFKITDHQNCVCGAETQSVDHIINYCTVLDEERLQFKTEVLRQTGKWPVANNEIIENFTSSFISFVQSIDFENITQT